MSDISQPLQQQVLAAIKAKTPLCIRGGNSKAFYGRTYGRSPVGEPLDVSAHRGIVSYEPTELVITARAGTPLQEIEDTLAAQGQMLAFEPPRFGEAATLGGTIACNLSGPRRAYAGAARDFVLGTRVLNGKAELLSFGGEVMKNVAGYDVSRLMAGALGTLGVLLEVSLKVLPRPEAELTLIHSDCSAEKALEKMHAWAGQPLPISATSHSTDLLRVRLSGTADAVQAAQKIIGGEAMKASTASTYWLELKEHQRTFFNQDMPLWRLSVASDTPPSSFPLALARECLIEWGGAQRWLFSKAGPEQIRAQAGAAGGHATLFRRTADDSDVFQPLSAPLMQIHRQLKTAFDPHGILNPGRMYAGL